MKGNFDKCDKRQWERGGEGGYGPPHIALYCDNFGWGDYKAQGHLNDAGHNRIDVLDGWRTVSVALVILSHVLLVSGAWLADTSGFTTREIYIPMIGGLGILGVDIFFVSSSEFLFRDRRGRG